MLTENQLREIEGRARFCYTHPAKYSNEGKYLASHDIFILLAEIKHLYSRDSMDDWIKFTDKLPPNNTPIMLRMNMNWVDWPGSWMCLHWDRLPPNWSGNNQVTHWKLENT